MTKHTLIIFFSIAAILVTSCKPPEQDKSSGLKNMAPPPIGDQLRDDLDIEPNDSFLQAHDLTLTSDELHFIATLSPGDIDSWKLKAKAGTIVEILVTPENQSDIIVDFSVSDKEGDRRYYDQGAAGKSEHLTHIRLSPQGGYLTVRGRNDTDQRYSVSIRRMQVTDPKLAESILEAESNDSPSQAQSLQAPALVEASANPRGDQDFFRLSFKQAAIVEWEGAEGEFELSLWRDKQILWSAIVNARTATKTPILTPDQSGTLLSVKYLSANDEIPYYRLNFRELDQVPNELEPNDNPAQAQNIDSYAQALEFSFLGPQDVDYFKVTAPPDVPSSFVVHAVSANPQGAQSQIGIAGLDGTARQDVAYNATHSSACRFEVPPNTSFLVRSSHQANPLPYPQDYRLLIEAEPADNFEREPNNVPAQAQTLVFDKALKGNIFPASDVDIYQLDLSQGPDIQGPLGKLEITIEAGYVAQLQLQLQDAEGYEISQVKISQFVRPTQLSFDAPRGKYYLVMTGSGDNCVKNYNITAKFTPSLAVIEAGNVPIPIAIDSLIDAAQRPNNPNPPDVLPPNTLPVDVIPKIAPPAATPPTLVDDEDAFLRPIHP